jgi:DNA-binding transcriptional MerR regulator
MKSSYSIGEFAKLVGVSVATLRRSDRAGILKASRRPTGHRFYIDVDLKTARGHQ